MNTSFPHNALNFMGIYKEKKNRKYSVLIYYRSQISVFVYSDSLEYFYDYLSNIYSISHI